MYICTNFVKLQISNLVQFVAKERKGRSRVNIDRDHPTTNTAADKSTFLLPHNIV